MAVSLGACVPQPPAPAPRPVAVARPAPLPPPAQATRDWRDAPTTPGDWQWSPAPGGSIAQFAGGQFAMRCDPAKHTITLVRAMTGASASTQMSITTTEATRTLITAPVNDGATVTLAARDPLLDAMAFSRGRFAIAVQGSPTLYIPSWTEISRVIEDCR